MFDLQAVDPAFKAEIRGNILGNLESDFLKMFPAMSVNNITGETPYFPSNAAYRQAGRSSKTAIAGKPKAQEGGLGSGTYRFKEKFAPLQEVHKSVIESLSSINSAELLLDHLHKRNLAQIAGDFDAEGSAYLKAIGQTVTATAVWSNVTTARFVKDMDAMFDKVPGANFVVMGESEAREASALPFATSANFNFSAVEQVVSNDALAGFLMNRYKTLQNVYLGGSWYNTKGEANGLTLARQFDGVVAVGDTEAVMTLDWPALAEYDEGYRTDGSQVYYELAIEWLTISTGDPLRLVRLESF